MTPSRLSSKSPWRNGHCIARWKVADLTTWIFPRSPAMTFGIEAIELVNTFFKTKARDSRYLTEFKKGPAIWA